MKKLLFLLLTLTVSAPAFAQTQRDYALVLMGALIASFKDVGSYWTGSTASSQSKDATIAQMTGQTKP